MSEENVDAGGEAGNEVELSDEQLDAIGEEFDVDETPETVETGNEAGAEAEETAAEAGTTGEEAGEQQEETPKIEDLAAQAQQEQRDQKLDLVVERMEADQRAQAAAAAAKTGDEGGAQAPEPMTREKFLEQFGDRTIGDRTVADIVDGDDMGELLDIMLLAQGQNSAATPELDALKAEIADLKAANEAAGQAEQRREFYSELKELGVDDPEAIDKDEDGAFAKWLEGLPEDQQALMQAGPKYVAALCKVYEAQTPKGKAAAAKVKRDARGKVLKATGAHARGTSGAPPVAGDEFDGDLTDDQLAAIAAEEDK